jgi:hypothetical protein
MLHAFIPMAVAGSVLLGGAALVTGQQLRNAAEQQGNGTVDCETVTSDGVTVTISNLYGRAASQRLSPSWVGAQLMQYVSHCGRI